MPKLWSLPNVWTRWVGHAANSVDTNLAELALRTHLGNERHKHHYDHGAHQQHGHQRPAVTDLVTRLADAMAYEDFAMRSPSGYAIPLPGRGERGRHERPFWSKGWKGCHFNCGCAVDDWSMPLVGRITVKDGTVTVGRYCR